jgi:hypothetical protein
MGAAIASLTSRRMDKLKLLEWNWGWPSSRFDYFFSKLWLTQIRVFTGVLICIYVVNLAA